MIFSSETFRRRFVRLVPFLALLLVIPMTQISLDSHELVPESGQMPSTLHAVSHMVKNPLAYLSTRFSTNSNQTSIDSMTPLEYLITQFRVVASYQRMLVIPTGLNFIHDFPFFRSMADPEVLFSLLVHVLALAGSVWLLRFSSGHNGEQRLLARIAGFGIIWFYVALAIECSILPIDDHFHEYRIYLPAFGFIAAFVALCRLLTLKLLKRRSAVLCCDGVMIAAVLVFSIQTILRNEQWRDPLVFWQDALAKSPGKKRIHGYIGNVYRDRGDMHRALQEYRLMLADDFRYWSDHFELGNLMMEYGLCRDAVASYRTALKIAPDKLFIHGQLAAAYRCLGEADQATRAERAGASGNSAGMGVVPNMREK